MKILRKALENWPDTWAAFTIVVLVVCGVLLVWTLADGAGAPIVESYNAMTTYEQWTVLLLCAIAFRLWTMKDPK